MRPIYIYGNIFLNNSHNIQTKTVEKNTHFMLNVEKNGGARQSTDDDITRRIHSPCQITKARTHTHSEYVIIIALLWQQWLRERLLMLRYTYDACRVILSSHLICGLAGGLFTSGTPHQSPVYTSPLFHACPTTLILDYLKYVQM